MKKTKYITLTFLIIGMVITLMAKEKPDPTNKEKTENYTSGYEIQQTKNTDKMKKLIIKKIDVSKKTDIKEAEILLKKRAGKNSIDVVNWESFKYKPKVEFSIGHAGNEIWLKYYVTESHIKALETKTNGDVYKDCCVEFFISFDSVNYYNFEFNCIGTKQVGYGPGRNDRKKIDPKLLDAIQVDPSLGTQPFEEKSGQFDWQLMVIIPVSCFVYDNIRSLEGVKATANFYKCGDETSVPHFLSWNPIGVKDPDFHRPDFFGILQFE